MLWMTLITLAVLAASVVGAFAQRHRTSRMAIIPVNGPMPSDHRWWALARWTFAGEGSTLAWTGWLMLLDTALALAAPWPVKFVIDQVLSHQPFPTAVSGLATLNRTVVTLIASAVGLLLLAAGSIVGYLTTYLSAAVAQRCASRLRISLMHRILDIPPQASSEMPTGELALRVNSDTSRVSETLVTAWETLVPELSVLGGMLLVTSLLDWRLTIVALLIIPLFAATSRLRNRAIGPAQAAARDRAGQLAATITDILSRLPAVHVFGQSQREIGELERVSSASVRATVLAVDAGARYTPILDILPGLGLAGALMSGTFEVSTGRLTIGGLVVFLAYLSSLTSPVRALSRLSGTMARAAASRSRLADLYAMPTADSPSVTSRAIVEPPVRAGRHPAPHRIEFADISVQRGGQPVLQRFTASVRHGEIVCLDGPSGSGKTTLLWLLAGLVTPDEGMVLIDGRPMSDITPPELRTLVSLVPQDPWLRTGTITDNICYGRPAATRTQWMTAARSGGVADFADDLPHGFDTQVGELGVRLSGGQQRRIAIARALLCNPPILLLDEPTAGLDHAAKESLIEQLLLATRGRTIILATHDPAVARLCDRRLQIPALGLRSSSQPHRSIFGTAIATAAVAGPSATSEVVNSLVE